ncbi:Uncharacterised protein [Streptococcus pneumoniae]|nr:Uncharacterised protein [Streptococcus pneumoniae]
MKKEIPFGIAIIPIIITVAVMMVTNGMILKKQCIKGFVLHYLLSSLLFLLA